MVTDRCFPIDGTPERTFEAFTALVENYGCGELTVQHLQQALSQGDASAVDQFVTVGGARRDRLEWSNATRAQRFGLMNIAVKFWNYTFHPAQAIERYIVEDPHLRPLFVVDDGPNGWCDTATQTLCHFEGKSTAGYPRFWIHTVRELTTTERSHVQEAFVRLFSRWARKPIDPTRIIVRNGPERRQELDTSQPKDKYGFHPWKWIATPGVYIDILPPPCPSVGERNS